MAPDPAYLALAQGVVSEPVLIVKLTIAGTSGNNTYYFGTANCKEVGLRLGLNIIPSVEDAPGVSAEIQPDKAVSQRGTYKVKLRDEVDAEALTNITVVTGSTFWRRFLVAYPGFFGAKVEVIQFWDSPTMTLITQGRTLFLGQLEDIDLQPDGMVSLTVGDKELLKDVSVPSSISDTNLLTAGIISTDVTIPVTDSTQFTDPAKWSSVAFVPPVALIGTERIVYKSISGNDLTVARNRITRSEEFANAAWVKGAAILQDGAAVGPLGSKDGADFFATVAFADISQSSGTLAAASNTISFEIWVKEHPQYPGKTVRIQLEDAPLAQIGVLDVVLSPNWTRAIITKTFAAAAGNVRARIRDNTGVFPAGGYHFYIAQAHVHSGSTSEVYVRSEATESNSLGRGAYGTTAAAHSNGDRVMELVAYRRQGTATDATADGLSPVWIERDLLNRSYALVADVDTTAFQVEADYIGYFPFNRIITDARTSNELMAEVRRQALLDLWSGEDGLLRTRFTWRPSSPGETVITLVEEDDIVFDTLEIASNRASRVNYAAGYYELKPPSGGITPTGNKVEDFNKIEAYVDLLSAGGTVLDKLIATFFFSRWILRKQEMRALVTRTVNRFKNGVRKAAFQVGFQREADFKIGDVIMLDSELLVTALPATPTVATRTPTKFYITSKDFDFDGGSFQVQGYEGNYGRYGFIGHNGTPDYDAATGTDPGSGHLYRDHAFIATNTGTLGAALDPAYLIQ